MKFITTALLILYFGTSYARATVFNSNGSASDVQAKINGATSGDTVTMPAGSFTWSTPITVSKAIKLQGAGSGRIIGDTKSSVTIGTGSKTFSTTKSGLPITAGQTLRIAKMPNRTGYEHNARENYMEGTVTSYSGTTLVMNITSVGGSGTWRFWWIATKPTTTIRNDYDNGSPANDFATPLIKTNMTSSGQIEISGIQFFAVSGSNSVFIGVGSAITEKTRTIIHDCWFQMGEGSTSAAISSLSNSLLLYNCSFDDATFLEGAVHARDSAKDTGWLQNSTMGTNDTNGVNNMYIEDCDFHGILAVVDYDDNIRLVFRHNIMDNSGCSSHGADTSPIGLRHFEIYDNELVFDSFAGGCEPEQQLQHAFWIRGGTGVITDNALARITSTCGGTKENIVFSVLNTRRDSGPYCCWTTYPAPHQVGQGYGPGAIFHEYTGCFSYGQRNYYTYAEPVYIWGNSGTGGNIVGLTQDVTDACGNGQDVADYIKEGRDYKLEAKPGYTKYAYPHPLRGENSGDQPQPPDNLHIQ